ATMRAYRAASALPRFARSPVSVKNSFTVPDSEARWLDPRHFDGTCWRMTTQASGSKWSAMDPVTAWVMGTASSALSRLASRATASARSKGLMWTSQWLVFVGGRLDGFSLMRIGRHDRPIDAGTRGGPREAVDYRPEPGRPVVIEPVDVDDELPDLLPGVSELYATALRVTESPLPGHVADLLDVRARFPVRRQDRRRRFLPTAGGFPGRETA